MATSVNFPTYGFINDVLALNEENWRKFFKPFIYDSVQSGLVVSEGTGMTVNVSAGECRCGAVMGILDNSITLDVANGHNTYNRIDSVIVQYSYNDPSTLSIRIIQGTPASNPVPPTLSKVFNTLWQMEIAQILVSANATESDSLTITDKRVMYDSMTSFIDDSASDGDTNHVWSANKSYDEITGLNTLIRESVIFQDTIGANDDLNDYTNTGLYRYINNSEPTNAPVTGSCGVVIFNASSHSSNKNRYIVQIVYRKTEKNQRMFYRTYDVSFSGWNDWDEFNKTNINKKSTITSSDNADTIIETGIYHWGDSNFPMGIPDIKCGGYLHVLSSPLSGTLQIASFRNGEIFARNYYSPINSLWNTWVLINGTNIPFGIKLPVSNSTISVVNNEIIYSYSDTCISTDMFFVENSTVMNLKSEYINDYKFNVFYKTSESSNVTNFINQTNSIHLYGGYYYAITLFNNNDNKLSPDIFYTVFEDNACFHSNSVRVDYLKKRTDREAIYGIEFTRTGASIKQVDRILDAQYLKNDYYDESTQSYINGGHNDFDEIYPWSEIKRCNMTLVNGKQKIVYENDTDDDSYTEDGTKNVMVHIPEFYYGREILLNGRERWMITATPKAGFTKFPESFIGAYQGTASNSGVFSIPNAIPLTSHYMFNGTEEYPGSFFNDYAEYNFVPFDFKTRIALQYLISIEFASINIGNSHGIGGFTGIPYGWGSGSPATRMTALDTTTNTHTVRLRCYNDNHDWHYYEQNGIADKVQGNPGHLCIGDTVSVSDTYQEMHPHKIISIEYNVSTSTPYPYTATFTLDGEAFNTTTGQTVMGGNPQYTGSTDSVYSVYHTGLAHRSNNCPGDNVSSWNNHFRHFIYRGMEDPWGNVYNRMCGIGETTTELKYTFDESKYNDQTLDSWESVPWEKPDYSGPVETINGKPYWILKMGFDVDNPTLLLAEKCNGVGNNDDFYGLNGEKNFGDTLKVYNPINPINGASVGGAFDHTFRGGIFMMRTDSGAVYNKPYWIIGCRPVYHTKK